MIIPLEQIALSPRIYQNWLITIEMQKNTFKPPFIVEDEQFRLLHNGIGEIFAKVNGKEICLRIPPDEWAFI